MNNKRKKARHDNVDNQIRQLRIYEKKGKESNAC